MPTAVEAAAVTAPFQKVSAGVLRSLADGFRSGRLGAGASKLTLGRVADVPESLVREVMRLLSEGMTPAHMALLLDARADAVDAHNGGANPIELVWTGPETSASYSRDTSVVVRELFESAQRTVLISTFVVRQEKAVFAPLAARMEMFPDLRVQVFLHIGRDWRDTRHESEILREFSVGFRENWPGKRFPEVYYDPRAFAPDGPDRATWHAKCVLVDDDVAFVTSANFTEWAQHRNVEAGVLIREPHFTAQLKAQFEGLVQARRVARLPGL
ncbi:MAG: phospholipase [Acidobacteria bacterium]|nr:phospholipase [Acidobacteriota bacterium]